MQVQETEIHQEHLLPKGVSLGALQVNQQYTETRMLPAVIQEGSSTKSSNSAPRRTSVPSAKSMVSSVRVPRIIQNSNPARKTVARTLRNASQVSKPVLSSNKAVASIGGVNATHTTTSSNKGNLRVKPDSDEEQPVGQALKQETVKGTVNLSVLVELLNVMKSVPTGYVEDLVKSMKENITSTGSSKSSQNQESLNAQENKFIPNNIVLPSSLEGKVQKAIPQTSIVLPQDSTNKIIPAVTTNLGIWPLTLFPSVSTSQSVTGGPRIARVAPIAPTTVVSSPGLTKAVRVCVTEAPHVSLEPPKKKSCDHIAPMEYQLIERNQLVSEPVVSPAMPPPIMTQSPVMAYSTVAQPTVHNVIRNHCEAQNNMTAPQPVANQDSSIIQPAPQVQSETTAVLSSANPTALNTPQEPMFQSMTPTLLQTISQAPQQVSQALNTNIALTEAATVNAPLNVSLGQSIQQLSHPMNVSINHTPQAVTHSMDVTLNQNLQGGTQALNVTALPSPAEVNQGAIKAEVQAITRHTSSQNIPIPSAVPTSLATSLFNQSSEMGSSQIVVGNHGVLNGPSTSQTTTVTAPSVASSALTHSDPLLSQSVSPMQLGQNGVAQNSTSNQPTGETRQRTEVLMTPSSTASQVNMQNEVTSAINLSETELLNYFDPNCFDNV